MWGSGELQRFYNITFRNAQPRKDKYRRDQPPLKLAGTSQGHTFCSALGLHSTPRGQAPDCSFTPRSQSLGPGDDLGEGGCLLHKLEAQSSGSSTHVRPKQQEAPIAPGWRGRQQQANRPRQNGLARQPN